MSGFRASCDLGGDCPQHSGSPLPVYQQGSLGSALQENHREKFYPNDLEEKMVHKVTMDTVRIITSSVSGMTHVSESVPSPWAAQWSGWTLSAPGKLGGELGTPRIFPFPFFPSHCQGSWEVSSSPCLSSCPSKLSSGARSLVRLVLHLWTPRC